MTLPTQPGSSPGPAPGSTSLPGFGRWAHRSGAEQVRIYSVTSLHVVAWFLLVMGLLAAAARLGEVGPVTVVVAVGVVLGCVVGWVNRRLTADASYRLGVLECWAPLLVVVVLALGLTVWGSTLEPRTGSTVVMLGVGALGWVSGAYTDRRVQWAALAAAAVASYVATSGSVVDAVAGAVVAGFFAFTVISSVWLLRVVTELDGARRTQAALAVAEERLRFSRDVHDVLGRHLSTVAVQSELAATLVRRGDPRAADKVLEVRATSHEALREARELARGYRPLDLTQELDGAVSLLRSAGIEARADLSGLAEAWHEPVARVVREAVTNVLRHSDARTVEIGLAGQVVTVGDDGTVHGGETGGDGSGLEALRDDLLPLGARLEAGPTDRGWQVRLDLADASPRDEARGEDRRG